MTKFKVGDWWRTRGGGEYVHILDVYESPLGSGISVRVYVVDGDRHSPILTTPVENLVQKMKPPAWEEDNE